MGRKISGKGIEMIKQFEGFRAHAYLDAAGVCTIGYGHTKNVKPGDAITIYGAESLLEKDLEKFEEHVNSYDNIYHWTQNEFDAMLSFAFNLGSIKGVTVNGTRTKDEIADAMLKYCNVTVNGTKKKLNGLYNRRKKEQDVFLHGYRDVDRFTDPYRAAVDVWKGKYGNGDERKKKLCEGGYDYAEVQYLVNLVPIAKEVIEGKWGNGNERMEKLAAAGHNYKYVQTLVNRILSDTSYVK